MKKRTRITGWFMVPIGLAWLCTGGCVEYRYWSVPADSYNRDFKPYISAEVIKRSKTGGIPLIYQQHFDEPPSGLRLSFISHTTASDPSLTFERVAIEIPDGTLMDLTDRFYGGVVPLLQEHLYIDDSHQKQTRSSLSWETTIDDCLPKATSFRLRIKGQLRSRGAVVEDFDAHLSIPLKYDSGRVTGWHWILADSV